MAERPYNVIGSNEVALQAIPTADRTIFLPDANGTLALTGTVPAALAAGTQTGSTGTFVFANSNSISFGMSGSSQITASFSQDHYNVIAAGTQTAATDSTVVFSNSNGLSFGMSNSSVVTASFSTLVYSNSNGVTFGINAGTLTASVSPSGGGIANAAGTQTATSGTVVFSNSNNVSFGMSNSSIVTASASYSSEPFNQVAAGTQTGAPGSTVLFSNSNGLSFGMSNSSIVTGSFSTLVYSNSNGVTFGINAGTLTASVQAGAAAGIGAAGAGTQTQTSGTLIFSNSNNMSFGMSNSSVITASYGESGITGIYASSQSALTASSGLVYFSNANNISFGLGSGASTSIMTASVAGGGGAAISAGTQSTNGGTVIFSNSNNISFGMSNSSVVTAQVAAVAGLGVSNTGNTAGNTGTSTVAWVLAGSSSLTLSQSTTPGGPNTIWLQPAMSQISQGQGISLSSNGSTISVIDLGVTGIYASSQTALTASSGLVYFSNANNISFGLGSGASTSQMTGSVKLSVGGIAINAATTYTSGTVVFSNSNGISFGTNGVTVTAQPYLVSKYVFNPMGAVSSTSGTMNNGSIQYIYLPNPVTFSRVDIPYLIQLGSSASAVTAAAAFSSGLVIYSRNGSTLSPLMGTTANTTYSWASNTANYSNLTGNRLLSFNVTGSLTAGEYWVYHALSSATSSVGAATTNLSMSLSINVNSIATANGNWADLGVATISSSNSVPFMGVISSFVSNTTQTLQQSQITGNAGGGAAINVAFNYPVILRNY